jgi:hypothetical protein
MSIEELIIIVAARFSRLCKTQTYIAKPKVHIVNNIVIFFIKIYASSEVISL